MRYRTKGQYVFGLEQLDQRLQKGLIGAWLGRPGSGFTFLDEGVFKNHGTISGGALWTANQSNSGYGLQCEGTDDVVTLGDQVEFSPSYFTLAFWVNWYSLIADGGVISKGATGNRQFWIWTGGDGNMDVEIKTTGTNAGKIDNVFLPVVRTWYHIALTWNGATFIAYVNGVNTKTATGTGTLAATDGTGLSFGRLNGFSFFNGKIADVLLYDHALTDAEIKLLYRMR